MTQQIHCNRRSPRQRAWWIGMLLLALVNSDHAAAPPKPNIVFIFTDDHSLQTIGAYNERLSAFCRKQGITPNIDRLAARGGLFMNSFCGNSLCSPSRAAILSALHSHANGVRTLSQPICEGVWTFPGALREAGYQTAVIGKWHLAKTPAGTDYWRLLDGQGTYWHPQFSGPNGLEKRNGYATDIITDMSLDWLKQRDLTKPFMANIPVGFLDAIGLALVENQRVDDTIPRGDSEHLRVEFGGRPGHLHNGLSCAGTTSPSDHELNQRCCSSLI